MVNEGGPSDFLSCYVACWHPIAPRRSPPVRGKAGFAHGTPTGACPVRGKAGFAHGTPAGACLAGEEDSSKVKVFRAKMVENLKRFS